MSNVVTPKSPTIGADGRPWPSFREAAVVWLRVAMLSFGGPAGQIAVMHRIVVEEKRWIGEARFLHALNFCMLLPGPEAQQLTIYLGWLMHQRRGGLVAGVLFILPGMLAVMVLSCIYALYGEVDVVAAMFFGLKAAVLAIVLQAVVRIGKKALRNSVMATLAGLSFMGIFFFDIPFPVIIIAAAMIGALSGRFGAQSFLGGGAIATDGGGAGRGNSILGETVPDHARPGASRVLGISIVLLLLWATPVIGLVLFLGPGNVFVDISVFFSKMAVVTFGGAYAVLAYVAQAAVETYGWLEPGEMLDGLGLAETTPGPLIMVTQFVGFLGAFRDAGGLTPLVAGVLGGLLTTWVTFVPCFLWIFMGAPYVEQLRQSQMLSAAFAAITAAVVGVILNLAVWFALHVMFKDVGIFEAFGLRVAVPDLMTLDPIAVALVVTALIAVFVFRVGMIALLGAAAVVGLGLLGVGVIIV
ncbi:MAG: chromate efflux transporter [Acidiferrobacteraceae bacterium]|nr:chromate efflux transporter [Acidiferrobacteraceae bacterium]MBT4396529.1 chromate efflux transporter [Acidiferrobacteraceae bacterium]